MVEVVSHIFENDDRLSERVMAGQYDLFTEDRKIILPRFWDATVEPDMKIYMEMRPVQFGQAPSEPFVPPVRLHPRHSATISPSRSRSRQRSRDYSKMLEGK